MEIIRTGVNVLVAASLVGMGSAIFLLEALRVAHLADRTSIEFVFNLCAFPPLPGLLRAFLSERLREAPGAAVTP